MKLSTAIRRALEEDPRSLYRLAKLSGVARPLLSRFLHGEGRLSIVHLDDLIPQLGLHEVRLVPKGAVLLDQEPEPAPKAAARKPKRQRRTKLPPRRPRLAGGR